jgi:hypothetical protein
MTNIVRLWTSAAFNGAYLCGGWASVRRVGVESTGFAGGERRTTARRMLLTGLAAGLRGLSPGAPVRIESDSPEARFLAGVLAGTLAGPEDDLELWGPVLAGCRGRAVTVATAPAGPDTPIAFAAAWAELSSDKAKTKGAFTAAIPKTNVSRIAWPHPC